jgi:hypothetical protein
MKGRFVMKKFCLALLVLIVSVPAMGAVNITLRKGPEPNSAIIGYTTDSEVRAFALDVTVSDKAMITASAKITRVGSEPNYYITPTNVGFTSLGTPSTLRAWPYNSPVVSADVNGCIIETASLYALTDPCASHRNAPPAAGDLVKFFVDISKIPAVKYDIIGGVAYPRCKIIVAVPQANAKRGKVVLKNATSVDPVLPTQVEIPITYPCAWLCPTHQFGDAAGAASLDGIVDLLDLLALRKSWNKTTADVHGTGNGEYNCNGDFNCDGVVDLFDLLILRQNWNQTVGIPSVNNVCP